MEDLVKVVLDFLQDKEQLQYTCIWLLGGSCAPDSNYQNSYRGFLKSDLLLPSLAPFSSTEAEGHILALRPQCHKVALYAHGGCEETQLL